MKLIPDEKVSKTSKIVKEIVEKHYESAFTNQDSLYSWIHTAIKEAEHRGYRKASDDFNNFLESKRLNKNGE